MLATFSTSKRGLVRLQGKSFQQGALNVTSPFSSYTLLATTQGWNWKKKKDRRLAANKFFRRPRACHTQTQTPQRLANEFKITMLKIFFLFKTELIFFFLNRFCKSDVSFFTNNLLTQNWFWFSSVFLRRKIPLPQLIQMMTSLRIVTEQT